MNELLETILIPAKYVEPFVNKAVESERNQSCVILGSFRFYDKIAQTASVFKRNGIHVLAPDISEIEGRQGEFQILESDKLLLPRIQEVYELFREEHLPAFLEARFLRTIKEAGFVYIVSENGYAGMAVAGELSYAMAAGKPIYSSESLDPTLDEKEGIIFPTHWRAWAETIKVYDVNDMVAMVNGGNFDEEDYSWCEGYVWKWS